MNDYLICVGTLVRLVKDDAIRTTLLKADTPRQFLDALQLDEFAPAQRGRLQSSHTGASI